MKTANKFLAVLLCALLVAMAYFYFATDMKVDAAAARDGDMVRCELTLSNGSLFNYEYLEFLLLSPEDAEMAAPDITGENVDNLSQKRTSVLISGIEGDTCRLEIGYYVLGLRKSVTVTVE